MAKAGCEAASAGQSTMNPFRLGAGFVVGVLPCLVDQPGPRSATVTRERFARSRSPVRSDSFVAGGLEEVVVDEEVVDDEIRGGAVVPAVEGGCVPTT
jgi:hypothetical protein